MAVSCYGKPSHYAITRGKMQTLVADHLIGVTAPFVGKSAMCNVLLASLLCNAQGN